MIWPYSTSSLPGCLAWNFTLIWCPLLTSHEPIPPHNSSSVPFPYHLPCSHFFFHTLSTSFALLTILLPYPFHMICSPLTTCKSSMCLGNGMRRWDAGCTDDHLHHGGPLAAWSLPTHAQQCRTSPACGYKHHTIHTWNYTTYRFPKTVYLHLFIGLFRKDFSALSRTHCITHTKTIQIYINMLILITFWVILLTDKQKGKTNKYY